MTSRTCFDERLGPRTGPRTSRAALLGLSLSLLCLPGCFTGLHSVGSPLGLPVDCSAFLEVGHTTRDDVLEMFGSPTQIQSTHKGDVFRYLYQEIKQDTVDIGLSALFGLVSVSLFRTNSDRKDTENLTVFFSAKGKLLGWSYSPLLK